MKKTLGIVLAVIAGLAVALVALAANAAPVVKKLAAPVVQKSAPVALTKSITIIGLPAKSPAPTVPIPVKNPVPILPAKPPLPILLTIPAGDSSDDNQCASASHEEYVKSLEWGGWGNKDGEFHGLIGIALDNRGNVYATDCSLNSVQKFDNKGIYLDEWGEPGSGDGQLQCPDGVAVDNIGNVYVANSGNHHIKKFDNIGMPLDKLNAGENPIRIAVDGSKNIFVIVVNSFVKKFNSNGELLRTWGGLGSEEGQFIGPDGIEVDSFGNVYVADTYNNRVQKFDNNGLLLRTWGKYGNEDGQFQTPHGIAVDSLNNVYVADYVAEKSTRIQKFDSNGKFITKIVVDGGHIQDMAVDTLDNSIYVVKTADDVIAKYIKNPCLVSVTIKSVLFNHIPQTDAELRDMIKNHTGEMRYYGVEGISVTIKNGDTVACQGTTGTKCALQKGVTYTATAQRTSLGGTSFWAQPIGSPTFDPADSTSPYLLDDGNGGKTFIFPFVYIGEL